MRRNESDAFNAEVLKMWCEHTGTTEQYWIDKLKALPASPIPGLPADFITDEILARSPRDHRATAVCRALQDLLARKPWNQEAKPEHQQGCLF